jgi:ribosome-associated protein
MCFSGIITSKNDVINVSDGIINRSISIIRRAALDIDKIAKRAYEILEDKKAKNIEIIDISKISTLADYFIICSGTSTIHIRTIADELELKMGEAGYNLIHKEGYESARWILLDFGELVIHIFHEEDRSFYNLERLWADGKFRTPDDLQM